MSVIQKIPEIKQYLIDLQNQICAMLEKEDGNVKFIKDKWTHNESGGGVTCAMSEGQIIEKAGVNFSHVTASSLPSSATAKRPELADSSFQALGVSVIVHPKNPYAPTTHANVRFILVEKKSGEIEWWFGGGFDLTPYYGFPEDCKYWHETAKNACDPFGTDVYPRFKKWCDDYFYLKHRSEPRGIGGLFFDDLKEWGFEKSFNFMQSIGNHFIKAYQPILARRKDIPFTDHERDFQCYRRGRYVEFNLLYDRGTLFGLQSGGRTESILISMPPHVIWKYDWKAEVGSAEEKLLTEFLIAREWV